MTTIKLLFIYESSLTVLHLRAAISLVGSSGGPHKYLFFLLKKFVGPIIGPTRIYQSHLRVLWNSFDLEYFRAGVLVTCVAKEHEFCQTCSFAQAGLRVGAPEGVRYTLYSLATK